eukprot:gnl/MRDRNA2_/MRDRNA2_29250_c0_seq1.p1 gnl/MRDRNA2_/MRDRNA2_29250_c0~~gnl/MRDRNA2_/MRDRNA2_29250_c0_seq1.p1  ORF type:complete len:819 (+),score=103.74 gnl/MRDRNA2_/MRDRNA2_29250_c0_seq1:64-2457(+)
MPAYRVSDNRQRRGYTQRREQNQDGEPPEKVRSVGGCRPALDEGCFLKGRVCLHGVDGTCSEQHLPYCASGQHPRQGTGEKLSVPNESEVLVSISRAKMRLLQAKWNEAGGHGELYGAWQVRNRRLDRLFRASSHNLLHELGRTSDMIDGWHGTAEENVLSIARHGFDPSRRAGQAYGAGEYFAKDPNVSISYAKGGSFMFLCKLLLGAEHVDHTWVKDMKYYVVKQRDGLVQALPVYLVQFQPSGGMSGVGGSIQGLNGDVWGHVVCDEGSCWRLDSGRIAKKETHGVRWTWVKEAGGLPSWLRSVGNSHDLQDEGTLQYRQRGGQSACVARKDAGMSAESTQYLWVGWLAPELARSGDDAIFDDVCKFLSGIQVLEVIPERNGARVGAFVKLAQPVSREFFKEICSRKYRREFQISVDDAQPSNPRCAGKPCPRLTGPSRYCRGWNIRGHHAWQWGCPFDHPLELRPTHGATYTLEEIMPNTAKYDEIQTALLQGGSFHNGFPRLVGVHRVVNHKLAQIYEQRRTFLAQKHGFTVEKELWHGTNCKAIPEMLTHGLQPPSDTRPSDSCPVSGNKGLCTTLCGSSCRHCCEPHHWGKCHMYGLGVYLADLAQKSHRYVREPEQRVVADTHETGGWYILGIDGDLWGQAVEDEGHCWRLDSGRIAKKETEGTKWNWKGWCWDTEAKEYVWPECVPCEGTQRQVYSMLWCRVCLGSPFLIEGNLLSASAMHNFCWCQDPSEQLETVPEEWNVAQGHDSFYVRGLAGSQQAGLGVYNSEYIVFQPNQVQPLYRVDYVLD